MKEKNKNYIFNTLIHWNNIYSSSTTVHHCPLLSNTVHYCPLLANALTALKPSRPEVGVGTRSYLLNDLLHHAEPRLLHPQQGLEGAWSSLAWSSPELPYFPLDQSRL